MKQKKFMVKFTEEEIKRTLDYERNEMLEKHQNCLENLLATQKKELDDHDANRLSEVNKMLEIFEEYKDIKDLEGTVFKQSKKINSKNDYFIMILFREYGINYKWNNYYKSYEFSCRPETRIERLKKQMEALQHQIDEESQKIDTNKKKVE